MTHSPLVLESRERPAPLLHLRLLLRSPLPSLKENGRSRCENRNRFEAELWEMVLFERSVLAREKMVYIYCMMYMSCGGYCFLL